MTAQKKEHLSGLSEAQLEIMGVLWDRGEAGISEIRADLNKRRSVSRETVMIQVLRLERRHWLKRRKEGIAYVYRPARQRNDVAGAMASHLVDAGFGGSTESLVKTLLDIRGVDRDEIERLKKLIDEAGAKPARGAKQKSEGA
jgi:BlaI family penicillinase repressor